MMTQKIFSNVRHFFSDQLGIQYEINQKLVRARLLLRYGFEFVDAEGLTVCGVDDMMDLLKY